MRHGKQGNTAWQFRPRLNKKEPTKTKPRDIAYIAAIPKKAKVNPKEQAALMKLAGAQQKLTTDERGLIDNLLKSERPGIDKPTQESLQRALDDDLQRDHIPQSGRYLRVENETGQDLRISLHYMVQDGLKNLKWYPADPTTGRFIALTLKNNQQGRIAVPAPEKLAPEVRSTGSPGVGASVGRYETRAAVSDPVARQQPVLACRIRIWAEASTETWNEYRHQDLILVPEQDADGKHLYFAAEPESYTFKFLKKETRSD